MADKKNTSSNERKRVINWDCNKGPRWYQCAKIQKTKNKLVCKWSCQYNYTVRNQFI